MIYHHDDAEQASAVMHYHADQVKQVGKLAERLLYIFAACIALPLLAHLVATSDAASAVWQWLMSCDGVLLCGLAAVQMRPAKQQPTVPDELLARAYPDHLPSHEYNRKELLRAIAVVRGTPRGWVVDIKNQERTQ